MGYRAGAKEIPNMIRPQYKMLAGVKISTVTTSDAMAAETLNAGAHLQFP